MPKSRADYWTEKFEANVRRDDATAAALRALGWRVTVIWECETKTESVLAARLRALFGLP